MIRKPSQRYLIIFLIILMFSLVSYLVYQYVYTYSAKSPIKNSYSQKIIHYKNQINTLGSAKAYDDFKKNNRILTPALQHNTAHIFGEALYSSAGLDGITVCDSEFNYGCYHSLIGNALAKEGLEKITNINYSCTKTKDFLKCQHGIGHGIVAFLGYQYDNLKQALAICDSLHGRDPIGGCFTGVFMEYNFQTMLADDAQIRDFNKTTPLFPCSDLSVNFQDPCLYEQANWWLQVLPGSFSERIGRIDQYCNGLSESQQEACYSGLGIHIPAHTNWDNQKTVEACQIVKNEVLQSICIYSAASDFSSRPEFASRAIKICNSVPFNEKQTCYARAGIGKVL